MINRQSVLFLNLPFTASSLAPSTASASRSGRSALCSFPKSPWRPSRGWIRPENQVDGPRRLGSRVPAPSHKRCRGSERSRRANPERILRRCSTQWIPLHVASAMSDQKTPRAEIRQYPATTPASEKKQSNGNFFLPARRGSGIHRELATRGLESGRRAVRRRRVRPESRRTATRAFRWSGRRRPTSSVRHSTSGACRGRGCCRPCRRGGSACLARTRRSAPCRPDSRTGATPSRWCP
ncbi:MAG: hypothetical protein RLY70_1460 [Planctomycetota bacterium]